MSDDTAMDALESELVHGWAMGDLAEVRAQQIAALTEQLAAAQAVIADVNELADAISKESHCSHLGRDIRTLTAQSPADALQAHDRQVAAKALADAADWLEGMVAGYTHEGPVLLAGRDIIRQVRARAVSLVPGTPETAEGLNNK